MKANELTLDQLGTVSRGRSRHRPRDAAFLYGGPYPFVQTGDVKRSGLYLRDYDQTYSEAGLAQSKLWPAGTLCITIAANIAETSILGIEACFPDSIIGFSADPEKADVRFIKYLFETVLKMRYQSFTQGATQDNLSQSKLLSIRFSVPDLADQKKFADFLSAYDNLIENNRRRIALLEQVAREVYREWFVRLRFPGHEKTRIVDGLPEGWTTRALGDIAEITMGQSPKSMYYNEEGDGLPFHQGVTDFGNRFPLHRVYCTVENRMANPGDLLFSVRAPVGRINITLDRVVIGRGIATIRSNKNQQSLLFYALKSHFFKEDMLGVGAIFAAIKKQDLYGVRLTQGNDEVTHRFMDLIEPMDSEIEKLHLMIESLTQARGLLLPRVMSGELKVRQLQ